MKLAHKIIFANSLRIIAIIVVAALSYHEFGILLTRLRFVALPDTLNESFLNIRLLEKNYFLYKDDKALPRIKEEIQKSYPIIDGIKSNIIKVMGDKNFEKLLLSLRRYEEAITKMERALEEYYIDGVKTTIPFHQQLMKDENFRKGNFTTKFMETFVLKK